MSERTCSISGCDSPARARGWCGKHWTRWSKYGDPEYVQPPKKRQRTTCVVDECETVEYAHGLCSLHYQRWRKSGDPLVIPPRKPRARKPKQPCIEDGCERPRNAHGRCAFHANRYRQTGDPNRTPSGRRRPNRHEPYGTDSKRLVMTRPDGTQTECLYDTVDHDLVTAYRWYVNAQGYVVATVYDGRGSSTLYRLARLILGLTAGDPRRPDHISGDRRDNRRSNLRIASHQRNVAHQAIVNGRGSSRFRNVSLDKRTGRWVVKFKISGVVESFGTYTTEEEAAGAAAHFRAQRGLPAGY